MTLSKVDELYWAVGFAGNVLLLLILIFRKYLKAFPAFSSLIAVEVFRTIVLAAINFLLGRHAAYFYSFWTLAIVDVALQLVVVVEIAANVFRPLGYWAPDIKNKVIRWALASTAVATLLTAIANPVVGSWYHLLILKGSFFSSALECALVVGIAALSWEGGFPWNSGVARIAVGFAVFALPDMLVETATTCFGLKDVDLLYQSLQYGRKTAYLCSLVFWIIALYRKFPPLRKLDQRMSDQVEAMNHSISSGLQTMRSERETQ